MRACSGLEHAILSKIFSWQAVIAAITMSAIRSSANIEDTSNACVWITFELRLK